MLIDDIERYIEMRRAGGYALNGGARLLRLYGQFALGRLETDHVRTSSALAWAAGGTSPNSRDRRIRQLVRFARFMNAEDERYEVPPRDAFAVRIHRPLPYIYSGNEIADLLAAAGRLRLSHLDPLRRLTYRALVGLIASTGLRKSEALGLRISDLSDDGVLTIRRTKFQKSRLVPLHDSVAQELREYLRSRLARAVIDDHLFLSASDGRIEASVANTTFRRLLKLAAIAPHRIRRPRLHDLRHTFATRALERCPSDRQAVARQFVALSTYLGHAGIAATQWYLEATPELMTDIAAAAERIVWSTET